MRDEWIKRKEQKMDQVSSTNESVPSMSASQNPQEQVEGRWLKVRPQKIQGPAIRKMSPPEKRECKGPHHPIRNPNFLDSKSDSKKL